MTTPRTTTPETGDADAAPAPDDLPDVRTGDGAHDPAAVGRAASVKRRKGRPVDADSAATRQAIVDAATLAFGRHGFEGTTMQHIASLSGITAPTLYHYFPSKAAIFRTVGDEVTREFRRRADAAMERVDAANLRIAGVLRALGDWIAVQPEIASFIATYAADVARNAEVRRISPAERWTDPMEYYARVAREGIERGELAADLDPVAVAGVVQGLVYGLSALVAVGRAFGPPEQLIDAYVRTVEGTVFIDPGAEPAHAAGDAPTACSPEPDLSKPDLPKPDLP